MEICGECEEFGVDGYFGGAWERSGEVNDGAYGGVSAAVIESVLNSHLDSWCPKIHDESRRKVAVEILWTNSVSRATG